MTVHRKIAGLCAAATLSLALAPSALAAPAGDEYLPKVPQSGSHSPSGGEQASSASAGTATTTLPTTAETSSPPASEEKKASSDGRDKKDKADQQVVPVASSGSGGPDGGDSSGSILLNPIVLLMIAAVIAVAIGMTLRRRGVDEGDSEPPGAAGPTARREASPRTPDGEIATGQDRLG
jgi:hypothetical protein